VAEDFGAWRLDALIAVGGLAEVWRGERDGQLAAIKRLHTHLLVHDEARRQFALEGQLARELPRHPGVVHAIEQGSVGDRPYLALELAPGNDLRRVIAPPATRDNASPRRVVLPRERALGIVANAAEAVDHLHAHGWIHGDVNPGNLVVDGGEHVVLVDLGIARRAGEAGTVRGTHAYMAPEQVRGEAWTPATDVFALGVVLWELVAGARLFHRGPTWLSMAAVVEDPVPALADPALDAIARAALQKTPTQRLASARELADRLRAR
jgi:serine/threonine protein kinase